MFSHRRPPRLKVVSLAEEILFLSALESEGDALKCRIQVNRRGLSFGVVHNFFAFFHCVVVVSFELTTANKPPHQEHQNVGPSGGL